MYDLINDPEETTNLAGLWSQGENSHSCDDYIKEIKDSRFIM